MATKGVTQFLRTLDLSGVDFGSATQHAANSSLTAGTNTIRRKDRKRLQEAASQIFPSTLPLERMARLESLKLRNTDLANRDLPSELKLLARLEYLSLAKNKLTHLTSITDWPKVFPLLRVLNCRQNYLSAADAIPTSIFECKNLQVVDFSHNELTSVPRGLENASNLLVLNLSQNKLTSIPPDLFKQCCSLLLLDFSDNCLESLPNMRVCSSLQQLILNRNPLSLFSLRSVAAAKQLEVLHLAGTQRRVDNIPTELDRLQKLVDLDISDNQLLHVPEPVFQLRCLKKLDVSRNCITEISMLTDNWPALEYLNLSYNQIAILPAGLTQLTKLRKLYINNNQLTFVGLPRGIGKLLDLQVFDASNNLLENIPEGLCRCGRLKRLLLSNNKLVTLPDAIHYLIESLEKFDVDNNPNLRFPQKPFTSQNGSGKACYNIDFSLDGQLRLMRGLPPEPTGEAKQASDSAARIRRLRRPLRDDGDNEKDSSAVLAGMRYVAHEKEAIMRQLHEAGTDEDGDYYEDQQYKLQGSARRWKDALAKPNIDYSEIFDKDAGSLAGVEIWVIDEFTPRRYGIDEFQGSLFDGDCYIVLESRVCESSGGATGNNLDWRIFYWIGSNTSLDKRACSAVHAVNLRNLLGAEGQTIREEQGDESKEFLGLFGGQITVLPGEQGYSGFLHVEVGEVVVKLYRLFGQEKEMYVVSMPVSPLSLDPKYVYLVDGNSRIYVWIGSQSRILVQTRGRLLAEKIVQKERHNEAEITVESEGRESNEFLAVITGVWKPPPIPNPNLNESDLPTLVGGGRSGAQAVASSLIDEGDIARRVLEEERQAQKQRLFLTHPKPPVIETRPAPPKDFISKDWRLPAPIVYDVKLGMGYLELLQKELPFGQLQRDILESDHVYLVDSGGELFVWIGKKTTKFLRYAGCKLAEELIDLMPRGCFGGAESSLIDAIIANDSLLYTRPSPVTCREGAEPQIFRCQFLDWEPAIAVDFTRTARSIAERGGDMNVIMERDKIKTDLRALLTQREQALGLEESMQLLQDLNHELVEPVEMGASFAHGSPTPSLQQFIILDGKWVPVESSWFGHFFSRDSYIVIATYWDDTELSVGEQSPISACTTTASATTTSPSVRATSVEVDGNSDVEDGSVELGYEEPTKSVVYFWQGREASDLVWLTFNFSLRKDMEARLSRNPRPNGRPLSVEFKRVHQQQEDMYFLAHFLRRMVIHSGYYRDRYSDSRVNGVQLYHLRMNGNPIATRCIEVKPTAITLNSCFSYICRVPGKMLTNLTGAPSGGRDQVYIWIGDKAPDEDEALLELICHQIYDQSKTEVISISEGGETAVFWSALGGQVSFDKSAEYMDYSRLFRLSNDAGYFRASEKCADFCQDDLINDDVMLLDTGDQIYVWLGKRTSDVEVKLSLQAAKLYKEQMARTQPSKPRQLKLTAKNAEPFMFRRCFHGWGPFYEPKDWSG